MMVDRRVRGYIRDGGQTRQGLYRRGKLQTNSYRFLKERGGFELDSKVLRCQFKVICFYS